MRNAWPPHYADPSGDDAALDRKIIGFFGQRTNSDADTHIYEPTGNPKQKYVIKWFHGDNHRCNQIMNRWKALTILNSYDSMKHFYGVFETQSGGVGLVMDYIEGDPLSDAVVCNLTATQKMIIIVGILAQLAILHHHGMVHRGLRPSCIIIDEKKYPHLIGWSRVAKVNEVDKKRQEQDSDSDALGGLSGIMFDGFGAKFIATECLPSESETKGATSSSDLWSFAMLCLYIMNPHTFRTCTQHMKENSECRIRNAAENLPWKFGDNKEFQEMLSHCLMSDPANRGNEAGRFTATALLNMILEGVGIINVTWELVRDYAKKVMSDSDGFRLELFDGAFPGEQEEEEEEEEEEALE